MEEVTGNRCRHVCTGVLPCVYWGGGRSPSIQANPRQSFKARTKESTERDQRNASWKECPVYYAAGVGFLATKSVTVGWWPLSPKCVRIDCSSFSQTSAQNGGFANWHGILYVACAIISFGHQKCQISWKDTQITHLLPCTHILSGECFVTTWSPRVYRNLQVKFWEEVSMDGYF